MMYRNRVLQCRFRSNLNPTQIWPLYQVLLGEKIFWGESPVCQTMIEGLETGEQSPNARTEKRVSVGMPHTNCVLRTCFVPQTAVLVRRGRRRAHLRLGRTQCSPRALCASIDPRGSEARPREAKRGGAEPRAGPRDAEGIWDEDLLAHSPGQSVVRVCEYASWWLEVYARGVRALTEGAAGGRGRRRGRVRRWKRHPTPSRRDGLFSNELLTSA